MLSNKKIRVQIRDMSFNVVGNTNGEYVKELAQELDRRISSTQRNNYRLNDLQAIVLTALNILDEKNKISIEKEKLTKSSGDLKLADEQLKKIGEMEKSIRIVSDERDRLKSSLEEKIEEIKTLQKEKSNLSVEMQKLKEEFNVLEEKNKSFEDELKITGEEYFNAKKAILDLNRQIEYLRGEE